MRKIIKKSLVQAPEQQCFWTCDGRILRNLKDLSACLKIMSDKSFHYHVGKTKNDFAKWIEEVLGDSALAGKIRRMKNRLVVLRSVEAAIRKYL